jgi:hypothetical protein
MKEHVVVHTEQLEGRVDVLAVRRELKWVQLVDGVAHRQGIRKGLDQSLNASLPTLVVLDSEVERKKALLVANAGCLGFSLHDHFDFLLLVETVVVAEHLVVPPIKFFVTITAPFFLKLLPAVALFFFLVQVSFKVAANVAIVSPSRSQSHSHISSTYWSKSSYWWYDKNRCKILARRFKTIFLVFFVAKGVLVVLVLAAIDRRDGDVERAVPAVVIGHELPRIEAQCKRQESRGWLEVWVAASGASMKEKCNSSVVGTDGSMIVRLDDQCEKTKAKADFSCRGGFPRCLRWNTARLVP